MFTPNGSGAAGQGGSTSAPPVASANGGSAALGSGGTVSGEGGASSGAGASPAVAPTPTGEAGGAAPTTTPEGTGGSLGLDPNGAGGSADTAGGSNAGSGTLPEAPGGFVSPEVNGGASAAFACPEGVTFGDPLAGMGAVQEVPAPPGQFFAFIEGPVWIGSVGRLFFSDNASGPERIWQLQAPFTTPSVFMANSGSNGLAVDIDDQLLLADQAQDRIVRVDPNTAQVSGVVVPTGPYNPNDLIQRSDGNLYFTDPNANGRGFYRVSPSGELSGPFTQSNAANAPSNPNGIELSPDENTLYVGDVNARFVASFSLAADGSVDTASGQRFVDTNGATVDGMAVDCAGNLYVGTQSGVEVYTPGGELLGTVPTGESSNATFGDVDRRTLFVTSRSVLKFVKLGVPGLPD